MSKDYYNILGVAKGASQDEIKKAFRKKAHEHHPDKGNGNADKFKEVNEAYQVLGNPEKRKQYDQFGSTFDQAGFGGQGAGGFNWQDFARSSGYGASGFRTDNINFDFGDLGDIFGEFFGGGSSRRRSRRDNSGADLETTLNIDFLESVFGVTKKIKLKKKTTCPKCHGNGAEPGTKIETCKKCSGKGEIYQEQRTFLGVVRQVAVCPDCQGEGKIASTPCRECGGQGITSQESDISVKIPAGIDDGQSIRLKGQGAAGVKGAASGDLYIRVSVKPDPDFVRDGYNIKSQKEINFSQAVLGDKVKIKTVDGNVSLKIPTGTRNNKVFILKNKGVPRLQSSGRGDHFVEIIVKIPKKLTKEQKKLVESLNQADL